MKASIPEDYTELSREVSSLSGEIAKYNYLTWNKLSDFVDVERGGISNTDGTNYSSTKTLRTTSVRKYNKGEKVLTTNENCRLLYLAFYKNEDVSSFSEIVVFKLADKVQEYVFTEDLYARFSFSTFDGSVIAEPSEYSEELFYIRKIDSVHAADVKNDTLYHHLNRKKVLVLGDSIMRGYGNGNKGPLEIIHDKYNIFTLTNEAVSGACMTTDETRLGPNASITNIALSLDISGVDYIICDGGFNDTRWGREGSVTDFFAEDDTNKWDTTNYCGAWEKVISYFYNSNPTVKILYVFPHYINAGTWQKYIKPSIIPVLEKWGVQYLDLQKFVPPLSVMSMLNKMYMYNKDGTHPNALGYQKFYIPFISNWIKNN